MKKLKIAAIAVCCTLVGFNTATAEKGGISDIVSETPNETAIATYLADCNINAGGDQTFCNGTIDTFSLFGSQSGIDVSTVSWTQVSGPAVTIVSPTSLITPVTGGGLFGAAVYQFAITGTCDGGAPIKSDTVTITITPDVSPASITDADGNPILTEPYETCRRVKLVGSGVGAGETSFWSSTTNPSGHSISFDGDTLNASMSQSYSCSNITYVYTTSNGGCDDHDTVEVRYDRQWENVRIFGGSRNLCVDDLRVQGTWTGCNAIAQWTLNTISGDPATITDTFGATDFVVNISFPPSGGTYELIYTLPPTSTCPGGSDTVIYNICYDETGSIGGSFTTFVCDQYPDTFFLESVVYPGLTYSDWDIYVGAAGAPTIVQTGVGQAYVLIDDQDINQYCFFITATGDSCTFPDGSELICSQRRNRCIRRVMTFDNTSDTLNIVCNTPGDFYRPIDYINFSGINTGFNVRAIDVPDGCTAIVEGQNYSWASSLDFSCRGTYKFRATTNIHVGDGVFCRDTVCWVVNVSEFQNPNAGSDSRIRVCDGDTVPLVGSLPFDIDGVLNPNVDILWTQVDGNTPVTFLGSAAQQIVDVTDFVDVAVYRFEYSYGKGQECELTDTMTVTVDSCPIVDCEVVCPDDVSAELAHCGKKDNCEVEIADIGVPYLDGECSIVSITNDAPADNKYPLGTTVVTWTIIDDSGEEYICEQNVTVTMGYIAELISEVQNGNCITYTLEVTCENPSCALSNMTVSVPCGTLDPNSLSNSLGFPMVLVNNDPNTGHTGFKVDDIQNFCEDGNISSMTVTWTVCDVVGTDCDPEIGFKAGKCVQYNTINVGGGAGAAPIIVSPFGSQNFDIFPNPNSGNDLFVTSHSSMEINRVKVTSVTGVELINKRYSNAGRAVALSVEELPNGVYLVSVYSGKTREIIKFIKN